MSEIEELRAKVASLDKQLASVVAALAYLWVVASKNRIGNVEDIDSVLYSADEQVRQIFVERGIVSDTDHG